MARRAPLLVVAWASSAWAQDWTDAPTGFNLLGVRFGHSTAGGGDVDGDGYGDFVVGAPHAGAGQVRLYRGGDNGPGEAALAIDETWIGELCDGSRVGKSLALGGDVDGDGRGDLLIGAPALDYGGRGWDEGCRGIDLGGAFLAYGAWPWQPPLSRIFNGDGSGGSVAWIGDLDGDAYHEGATTVPQEREVWLWRGPPWDATGASVHHDANRVTFVGDVNGDSYDDLLTGPPATVRPGGRWQVTSDEEGRESVAVPEPIWSSSDLSAADALAGGDLTGDGLGDIVVGAHGSVWIYLGWGDGRPPNVREMIIASPEGKEPGFATALSVGDVNGDGYADLLVGSPQADGDFPSEGRAYLYLSREPYWVEEGEELEWGMDLVWTAHASDWFRGEFGFSVAIADNVYGDGLGALLIGAPGAGDAGRVYLYRAPCGRGGCLPAGEECWEDADCASDACREGRCCDARCEGECRTCEAGTCAPLVAGVPCDGDGACDGAGECVPGKAAPADAGPDAPVRADATATGTPPPRGCRCAFGAAAGTGSSPLAAGAVWLALRRRRRLPARVGRRRTGSC